MEFTTSKGNKVLFKEYITGRDLNEYKKAQYACMKFDRIGNEVTQEFVNDNLVSIEVKGLQITVISFNGEEQATEKMLDLPADEYNEIVNEMNKRFFLANR